MGIGVNECYVVGDAVWDLLAARRAGMLSIGLLSGGYGEDELSQAVLFECTGTRRSCIARWTNWAYCLEYKNLIHLFT